MIVFFGPKSRALDAQISRHAKMDPEPVPAGKFEEHLFPACGRAEQFLPNESLPQRPRIAPPKNPLPRVHLHPPNDIANARVPAFSKIFDLGEFGHAPRLDGLTAPCYSLPSWKK
jgi:hypothetical protein